MVFLFGRLFELFLLSCQVFALHLSRRTCVAVLGKMYTSCCSVQMFYLLGGIVNGDKNITEESHKRTDRISHGHITP